VGHVGAGFTQERCGVGGADGILVQRGDYVLAVAKLQVETDGPIPGRAGHLVPAVEVIGQRPGDRCLAFAHCQLAGHFRGVGQIGHHHARQV